MGNAAGELAHPFLERPLLLYVANDGGQAEDVTAFRGRMECNQPRRRLGRMLAWQEALVWTKKKTDSQRGLR